MIRVFLLIGSAAKTPNPCSFERLRTMRGNDTDQDDSAAIDPGRQPAPQDHMRPPVPHSLRTDRRLTCAGHNPVMVCANCRAVMPNAARRGAVTPRGSCK